MTERRRSGIRPLSLCWVPGTPAEAHRADESIHVDELSAYEQALEGVCRMLAN